MRLKIFSLVSVLLAGAVVFYSCGESGGETQQQNQRKLPIVKVREVTGQSFSSILTVVGVVKPYATAKISSEEGGLLVSLTKDKGSYVGKGEIIAKIKKDVEIATYDQTEAQVELARVNYEKQKQLYEDNATTEMQYLTAKWQYEAAVRSLDVLKQRLKTGFVRSPISGVVNEKYMNKGEMTSPGSPIVNVIDISRVKVSAGIPEKYLTQIKTGQKVKVTADVLPGAEFEGIINYVAPSLSATSRTFEIELVINNKDRILKPEMSTNVSITQLSANDAVVLPQDLVVDLGSEKYIFVLEGDIAKKRVVTLGNREGNTVMITSGLNIGDKLIYEGFQQLVDGDKVQVIQ
ncbi:MAG: efflux RND transporter periplasmic adaptor subunit [Chlorobi bacterium]|nr:efflux RND transporter periplasmic adaptor subunit [Chlorobiota bacterium]MCI0714732.1 efflux RND transporter periplasmic adaptor subunit [Chlorobiota bacterium]